MALRILGEHPLAKDATGRLLSRIGTIFPADRVLVTIPGTHATQRIIYCEAVNKDLTEKGLPKLTDAEESALWMNAVDLIMDSDAIQIRPAVDNMPLAFEADEVLQEIVPKHAIHFLYVRNTEVYNSIKRRGECWRITPLPRSRAEMTELIDSSKIRIEGREIYYYNRLTGSRYLTCQEFAKLGKLSLTELRKHLMEIAEYSGRFNRLQEPEIAFFMAGDRFTSADFQAYDFEAMSGPDLEFAHTKLYRQFEDAVPEEFRDDDRVNASWRNQMYAALIRCEDDDEQVSEERLLGLASEFFMQIHWLPGGRIEDGELILDSIFDAKIDAEAYPEVEQLRDEKSRGFILNFVREFGDLEYVNVGRVIGSLALGGRRALYGRRDVYVAVVKRRDIPAEGVYIMRLQKWGIREHLDNHKTLLDAVYEAEGYTEYILDRRLGCRQLGMNLPPRVSVRRLMERYDGLQAGLRNALIWCCYFQRDYIDGIASDKIPNVCFGNEIYALRFAQLLGRAAAVNMIVGRADTTNKVLFDDGDEVVIHDHDCLPVDIVVADHTGTFADYFSPLADLAIHYAVPINRRVEFVANAAKFVEVYLNAFEARFIAIQQEYWRRRRAFDNLFKHQSSDGQGNLSHRWSQLLSRLDHSKPREIREQIQKHIRLP